MIYWWPQSWLCKCETKKVAWTEPYTIPTNQHVASEARKAGVSFDWLFSWNISNLSLELWTVPLRLLLWCSRGGNSRKLNVSVIFSSCHIHECLHTPLLFALLMHVWVWKSVIVVVKLHSGTAFCLMLIMCRGTMNLVQKIFCHFHPSAVLVLLLSKCILQG